MADRLADPSGAPPVLLWLATAVLVASALAGLGVLVATHPADSNPFLMADAGCSTAFDAQAHGPAVVAVGTSLLGHGVGASFQARVPGLRWRSCWANGGQWKDAVAAFPRIQSEHPAVLLIDESVLSAWTEPALQAFTDNLTRQLKRVLGRRQADGQLGCTGLPQTDPVAKKAYYDWVTNLPDDVRADALAWIARFRAAGTRIVVLGIPRAPALEAELRPVMDARSHKLRQLAASSGAAYWPLVAPAGAQDYCPDQAHVTPAGERQLEQQLAARLQAALRDAP